MRPESLAGDEPAAASQADHVPDFAIAVSNHCHWDVASTVVDPSTGRRASVQAAYADSAYAATLPENAFTGFVAAHKILHSWFPFYVGINEKRYPFIDEGWTTAFEYLATARRWECRARNGKAALGYLALKDLMGDAAFRTALHTFMARWHGKRPLPWDMFNSVKDAGVGNHTWFFQNRFFGYNYGGKALISRPIRARCA